VAIHTSSDIIAQRYVVSSSVSHYTSSAASGSHIFGDSSDDKHRFTGSLNVSQSVHYIGGQLYIDKPSDPLVQVSDGTRTMLAGYITSTSGLIGTTSNHPLEIRTNNTARINITNGGNVSFPTANAKISGSSSSTGSFGRLTVGTGDLTSGTIGSFFKSGDAAVRITGTGQSRLESFNCYK
jgi:hypothetical protein